MEHIRTVGLPEKLPEGVQLPLDGQLKPPSGDDSVGRLMVSPYSSMKPVPLQPHDLWHQ